jgi:phage gp36-like protein
MAYATKLNMLDYFGSQELSQLATPRRHRPVDSLLLELVITGGDTSVYSQEDIDLANEVIGYIESALVDASSEMDSHIRVHNTLPLTTAIIYASPLPRKCGDIARWILAESHPSEEIVERYNIALSYIRKISDGSVTLPTEDGISTPSSNRIAIGHTKFDWESAY